MSVNDWDHFFKPEVRTAGLALFNKGKLSLSQPSDTEIIIYIRATPGFKVIFKTVSVESQTVKVSCSCPVAKKHKFCKHVWAGLLGSKDKYADFFESKTELEMAEISTPKTEPAAPSAKSAAFADKQAAYSEKQANYRKEQYQKQKQRQKDFKESKKGVPKKAEFPSTVERALNFFSENGIELKETLDKQSISAAKKKLARVFHPDFGGKHDEIVNLNNFTDILFEFINGQ